MLVHARICARGVLEENVSPTETFYLRLPHSRRLGGARTCRGCGRGPPYHDAFHAAMDALRQECFEDLPWAGVDSSCQVLGPCLGILKCLHKHKCLEFESTSLLKAGSTASGLVCMCMPGCVQPSGYPQMSVHASICCLVSN